MKWREHHSLRSHVIAPVWKRLPERLRWRIVHLIDKSNRYCWADLVDDALCREPSPGCSCDVSIPTPMSVNRCATTCGWAHLDHYGAHECSCYCGKFQFTAEQGARERAR